MDHLSNYFFSLDPSVALESASRLVKQMHKYHLAHLVGYYLKKIPLLFLMQSQLKQARTAQSPNKEVLHKVKLNKNSVF